MTQLSAFDVAVSELVERTGCDRAKAEKLVREQMPHVSPVPTLPAKDDAVLEKAEQIAIRKLFIAYGFEVYNLSQGRASKQTPGLPDLWLFHTREPFSGWWESKRQVGGKLSRPQEEFREHCRRTCTVFGSGDRWSAAEFLVQYNLAARGDGQYGIVPLRDAVVTSTQE